MGSLRNKPHISWSKEHGEWVVRTREGFEYQVFRERIFEARYFVQDKNILEKRFRHGESSAPMGGQVGNES